MNDVIAGQRGSTYTDGTMWRTRSRFGRRPFLWGSLGLGGLGLLSGCGRVSLPWQPAKVSRIGWLAQIRTDDPARAPLLEAFQHGLREHGWVEGQNITLDFRSAEGQREQLPGLAAELVRLQPEVIVAAGGAPALQAIRDATSTIPIVFPSYGADPVAAGLAASLARPGGNLTGLTSIGPELSGKRLEWLKTVVEGLSHVAVLWNAANPTNDWSETQAAARKLELGLLSLAVRGPDDFASAFQAAIAEAPDALITLQDAVTLTYRTRIIDFAATSRLPALYPQREFADDGGLMVYGPNLRDLFWRAATYVDKILRGANPAELPIQRPTTFDFVINQKTANALGLTIPPSVLQQATEIIQ